MKITVLPTHRMKNNQINFLIMSGPNVFEDDNYLIEFTIIAGRIMNVTFSYNGGLEENHTISPKFNKSNILLIIDLLFKNNPSIKIEEIFLVDIESGVKPIPVIRKLIKQLKSLKS